MSENVQHRVLVDLSELLKPIAAAAENELLLRELAGRIGWDLDEIVGLPVGDLMDILGRFMAAYQQFIAEAIDEPPESLDEFQEALESVRALFSIIEELKALLDQPGLVRPPQFEAFARDLTEVLAASYLLMWQPALYYLGVLLTLIQDPAEMSLSEPLVDEDDRLVRFPHRRPRLRLGRIIDLVKDPLPLLRQEYLGPDGLATPEDAQATSDRLFPRLGAFLRELGLDAVYSTQPEYELDFGDVGNQLGATMLTVFADADDDFHFGATLTLSSAEQGDLGLVIAPFGTLTFSRTFDGWELGSELTVGVEAIAIGPEGLVLLAGPGTTSVQARISAIKLPDAEDFAFLLGSTTGTRLEIRHFRLSGEAGLLMDAQEYGLLAEVGEAAIVVAPEDGDGFLSTILPADGLRTNFDLALGWSNRLGLYFRGSAGLEAQLAVHTALGPLLIKTVYLSIRAAGENLETAVAATASVQLGPIEALVERVGLKATFTFPAEGGNLGVADVSLGFKPPDGIGLAVDGGGFKGGGFLRFEPDHERYAGVLELEYQERIELKAIGLLTTRLPGGDSGFSLLIIITSEFTPIQLGLGFTLNGVGGLLGLNRTARVERLRSGLRDNTLRSILFPENIIANADRILSDLRQVFPPQDGRFLFGPMARIGWGSPTLITVDLGLLIEVPQPVRVFILGVARALLPDEEAKLLQLQVNFLGEIDFERELFAFDASLFDSRLLSYTLSGDMAVRLKWGGSDPNFLLTVGGFHPAYDPPPLALPVLRRLTVQLLSGKNPRLTLETYFAVTSNTVQVGARLELYAAAGKFNVYGFLSFDALFQFNPFYFIAEVAAMLALRMGSKSIASIKLELTLEGTTPWKARGTATFKLCWFIKIKVRFNKTFGEERNTRLDDVAVLPLLQAALSDSGNWAAGFPTGRHQLVSVKEIDAAGDQVVAQPFGVLEISQRVVPLGVEVQKFGNQQPADGNRFSIEKVRIGEPDDAEAVGISGVQEQFAPVQFFEMTDSEKLSGRSFEHYEAGVRVRDSERLEAAYAAKRDVEYELFYIDSQRDQRLRPWFEPLRPEAVAFNAWASRGAVAASPLSFASTAKSALAPEAVQVRHEPFAVVNVRDLTLVNGGAVASSEAEAFGLIRDLIRDNPALEQELQVVPTFEVNRP